MTLTADVVYLDGLDFFGAALHRLPPDVWDKPTPCAGWTTSDVLGHVGQAVAFGNKMLRGEQPAWAPVDRPSDAVQGDPEAWWRSLADESRAALEGVDITKVVDSPRGPRSIADGLAFPAIDLFVHAWDMAQAAGQDVTIPDEVIEFAHSHLDPIPDEMKRGEKGVFGPEADVPTDATPTQRFLAYTGRRG